MRLSIAPKHAKDCGPHPSFTIRVISQTYNIFFLESLSRFYSKVLHRTNTALSLANIVLLCENRPSHLLQPRPSPSGGASSAPGRLAPPAEEEGEPIPVYRV